MECVRDERFEIFPKSTRPGQSRTTQQGAERRGSRLEEHHAVERPAMLLESRGVDTESARRKGTTGGKTAEQRPSGTPPEPVGIMSNNERLVRRSRSVGPGGADPTQSAEKARRRHGRWELARVEVEPAE